MMEVYNNNSQNDLFDFIKPKIDHEFGNHFRVIVITNVVHNFEQEICKVSVRALLMAIQRR